MPKSYSPEIVAGVESSPFDDMMYRWMSARQSGAETVDRCLAQYGIGALDESNSVARSLLRTPLYMGDARLVAFADDLQAEIVERVSREHVSEEEQKAQAPSCICDWDDPSSDTVVRAPVREPSLKCQIHQWADRDHWTHQAAGLGYEAGITAGSYVCDGNTTQETIRTALKEIADGDPAFWDRYQAPNLSGEMADAMTPQRLFSELDESDVKDQDIEEELGSKICEAWEEAARSAFEQETERELLKWVDDEPDAGADRLSDLKVQKLVCVLKDGQLHQLEAHGQELEHGKNVWVLVHLDGAEITVRNVEDAS